MENIKIQIEKIDKLIQNKNLEFVQISNKRKWTLKVENELNYINLLDW